MNLIPQEGEWVKMDTCSFQSDLPVDDSLLPRAPAPMGRLRRSSPQREVSSPHLTGVFEFFIIQAPLPDSSVMNIVNFGRASADSGFRKCFDVSCQMRTSPLSVFVKIGVDTAENAPCMVGK